MIDSILAQPEKEEQTEKMSDALGKMAKAWSVPLWNEAIDACSALLFERSEQRPSDGMIERQNLSQESIDLAQAALYAASRDVLKLKRSES